MKELLNYYEESFFTSLILGTESEVSSNVELDYDFYKIPAVPFQLSFQEPATPVMNGLLDLHDYVFFFIIIILSVVLILLIQVVYTFSLANRRPIFFLLASKPLIRENFLSSIYSVSVSFLWFLYFFSKSVFFFGLNLRDFFSKFRDIDFLKGSFKDLPFDLRSFNYNKYDISWNLTSNVFLKSSLDYQSKSFVDKIDFYDVLVETDFDYLALLEVEDELLNDALLLDNVMLGYDKKAGNFSFFNLYLNDEASVSFNEFLVFDEIDQVSDVDYFFYMDTSKNFVEVENINSSSDNEVSLDDLNESEEFFESQIVETILSNIIFTVYQMKNFLMLEFFIDFYNDNILKPYSMLFENFFNLLPSKDNEDFLISQALNNLFLNNVLSFSSITLQKNLRISYFNHSTKLEIFWTLIPILIIGLIITPSFFFMYAIDEDMESILTVRVIGHQWFWSYVYALPTYTDEVFNISLYSGDVSSQPTLSSTVELNIPSDRKFFSFDSYMLDNMNDGSPRLLATDSVLILPKFSHINCIITSSDVIHSWAIPSFGVKVDAVPGRLNRADVFVEYEGMFFGQCSELCGVNHSFMPIHIQVVSLSDFLRFLFSVSI